MTAGRSPAGSVGSRGATAPRPSRSGRLYFRRVVGLARRRLRGVPRRAADEEDVALSAFDSFFAAAAAGRFPQLADRHNLWPLLVSITAHKCVDLVRRESRHRRRRRGGAGRRDVRRPHRPRADAVVRRAARRRGGSPAGAARPVGRPDAAPRRTGQDGRRFRRCDRRPARLRPADGRAQTSDHRPRVVGRPAAMNSATFGELPLPLMRLVDDRCGRFEAAWRAGGDRPTIEDLLSGSGRGRAGAAVLAGLIALEADYRRASRRATAARRVPGPLSGGGRRLARAGPSAGRRPADRGRAAGAGGRCERQPMTSAAGWRPTACWTTRTATRRAGAWPPAGRSARCLANSSRAEHDGVPGAGVGRG